MNKTQLTAKTALHNRILTIALLLVLAIAAFFFIRSIVEKRMLLDRGETVTGIVLERDIHRSTSRSPGLMVHKISYEFIPNNTDQKVTQSDFYISKDVYDAHPDGSAISVVYLSNNPAENQPVESVRYMPTMTMNFLYLFLAIIAAIFTTKLVKRFQFKYGIKSPGWSFYLTSVLGFFGAFIIAAIATVVISKLVNLILS